MSDHRLPQPFNKSAIRILAIDPSGFSRTVLGEVLRGIGIQRTTFCKTTDEARDRLLHGHYDVILIEWTMSPMSGIAFSRMIRHMPDVRRQTVKIIMVSALSRKEDVINGRDAGVDEFVLKPISPAALEAKLKAVMETPRPWVDHPVYVGPCRRRKNSADYYGEKRREADRPDTPESVEEETVVTTPLTAALDVLKSLQIEGKGAPNWYNRLRAAIEAVIAIGRTDDDATLRDTASAMLLYVEAVSEGRKVDLRLLDIGVAALTQLGVLSQEYEPSRRVVARTLVDAVNTKLKGLGAAA